MSGEEDTNDLDTEEEIQPPPACPMVADIFRTRSERLGDGAADE